MSSVTDHQRDVEDFNMKSWLHEAERKYLEDRYDALFEIYMGADGVLRPLYSFLKVFKKRY